MPRNMLLVATAACAVMACSTPAIAQDGINCSQLIANAESRRQIPRGLLMAIAVTESGMNGIPNPHAMNIAGKSYFARDLEDMAQVISNNWTRGVRSIDVGCMQINLKYHGQKFSRLTDLLHSPTNVEYGASYLIKLAIDRGSWREGVMDYHNKNSAGRRQWYGCKVWNNYLRINAATKGFVNCGSTPSGSSVASNAASKVNTTPISIPGYNQGAASGPVYASASPTPRPAPVLASAAPMQGSMPIGSPLDSSPVTQSGPALPMAAPAAAPYDVPQPRQRVRGTIDLAAPGDNIGDITTSADPRASAFQSVRPLDWGGRMQEDKSGDRDPVTSTAQGGFARAVQSGSE